MTTTINASTSAGLVQTADTSGSLALQTAGTTAITVDTSQNVGIGATTINNVVTTYRGAGVNNYIQFTNSTTGTASTDGCLIGVSADDTALRLRVLEAAPMIFTTNDTERMRIDSSGRLFVGRTSASAGNGQVGIVSTTAAGGCLDLTLANGGVNYMTNTSGTAAYTAWEFDNSGTSYTTAGKITVSGSATTYATSSDYRLKENVQTMTGALAKVALLKPVTYKWKSDGTDGEGFIAHELAEVCPNAVTGEKDAVKEDNSIMPQGVDTSFLVATLTAAIQELKAINDTQAELISGQAATINAQSAALAALTARVVALEGK